ncbi:MAG: DUF5606 domain-containing protein [Candidatus Dadabacteria bacterium]
MDYSRIVAVTGLPGLYEVISSKTDGAIVRSLDNGSTKFISSRIHNLTHLESIEIYTTGENVTLADVFTGMKNSSEALPDIKDNKALKSYFEKVYPDLDFERVYSSDMKKIVNWFKVMQEQNIDFSVKPKEEDTVETTEAEQQPAEVEASAEAAGSSGEAKPKKPRKKKSEE